MGNANLGLKYTCVSCAARFFDLNRDPAVCPKCQTEQPKPKARVFAPPRGGTKRWPGQNAAQTAIPAEAEAEAADEAPELLDDADVIEPDVLDDDDDDDADTVVPPHEDET